MLRSLAGLSVGAVVGYLIPFFAVAAAISAKKEPGLVGENGLFLWPGLLAFLVGSLISSIVGGGPPPRALPQN